MKGDLTMNRLIFIGKRMDAAAVMRLLAVIAVFAGAVFCCTSVYAETDSENSLLQFTAGGHVLGFGKDRMLMATGSHALTTEFAGTPGVAPQTEGNSGNPKENPKAQALTKVTYPGLWEGITLVYEQTPGKVVKSTYTLAPRAAVSEIHLRYNVPVRVMPDGSLRYEFETGYLSESPPIAWQEIQGEKVPVSVSFRKISENETGFDVGDCDPEFSLVIDPAFTWHTFMGGTGTDQGYAVAVDGSGNVYVTGSSDATWGTTPVNPHAGGNDAFAAKLNSSGTRLWNTFMGGTGIDYGIGIAVDGSGNVYVAGSSDATWGTPLNPHAGGNDAFAAKLDSSGARLWHTFMGGTGDDRGGGIAVDGSDVYVAGQSPTAWGTLPVNEYSLSNDAFVVKLGTDGARLWHTFIGGTGYDYGNGIAVDGSGNMYVTGSSDATWGTTPVNPHSGNIDAFVAKLDSSGARLWNTFMGGTGGDYVSDITVDSSGNACVAGSSDATWGTTPVNAYAGNIDAFAAKLDSSSGVRVWNTFMGGAGYESVNAMTVDSSGKVCVAGYSDAAWGTPLNAYSGGNDAFAAGLNSNGALLWNTFMGGTGDDQGGGIAVDGSGNVYVSGYSDAAWGTPVNAHAGSYDAFVVKFSVLPVPIVTTNAGGSGGNVTSDNGSAVTARGVCWNTVGTPTTADNCTSDGTGTGIFSSSLTGLTSGLTYYVRAYATNANGTGYGSQVSFVIPAEEPATQASVLSFASPAETSLTLNWTRGNGGACIVLMKAGSAVDSSPADGMTYAANAAFGSGTQIGPGNFVVYIGSLTSIPVTGLTASTAYHAAVYEFNGSGGAENYKMTPAAGNGMTSASEPSTQTQTLSFTSPTGDSLTLNWTDGNGAGRIVLMKQGSAVDALPADGTAYTAGAFGAGTEIGTGNYVVYKGTGVTSATVSGLGSGLTYYAAAYEFNGSAGSENYLTDSPPAASETTYIVEPATQASAVNFTSVGGTSVTVNWTCGTGTDRIVLMKAGSAVDSLPADETAYTANAAFGTVGTEIGTGNYAVYNGTDCSVTVTGLSVTSVYHVAVYEFNGSGGSENYLITSPATGNIVLNTAPAANADAYSTNEDTPLAVSAPGVLANDTDGESNPLTAALVSNVSNGTLTLNTDGSFAYTPNLNFNGTDSFTYNAYDGTANSASPATVTITVNAVNDAPVITGQNSVSTDEDTPLTLVLGNLSITDVDYTYPAGFSLTVLSGANYTVSGNTVIPSANFNGILTVPVKVNDGGLDSNVFNLSVTVNAVNNPPVITGQNAVSTDEDTPLTLVLENLSITDVDYTYPAGFSLTVLTGINYTVSGNTITPSANFTGTLTVPVKVNDGGLDSNIFNLSVTVNAVNNSLVWVSGIEDVSVTDGDPDTVISLDGRVTCADNDVSDMTFTAEAADSSFISASVSGNILTLSYKKDHAGETEVTVTALSGGKSVSDTFSVTVEPLRYSVSGNVSYFSNLMPVPDMKIMLTGTDFYTGNAVSEETFTDASGNYLFPEVIRGEYSVMPFKNDPPDPKKLSAADAYLIAEAALGVRSLTPLQYRIADITLNGRVSGLDASRLGRFTAGLTAGINGAGPVSPTWISEPESFSFSLNADTENQDFTAALAGDVSGNYSPGASETSAREPGRITEITAEQGSVFCIPIVISDGTEFRGIDIDIDYDETVLSAREAALGGGILGYEDYEAAVNLTEPGRIRMAIFGYSGKHITGSGTVVNLYFDITGPVSGTSLLTFTRFDCNEIRVSDGNGERDETVTGGFGADGNVSLSLRIGVIPDDPMKYDADGSGIVDMRDAVQALHEGDPEGAIRALRILTGR